MNSEPEPSTHDLYDAYLMRNYAASDLVLVRGKGSRVWDADGKVYLDFTTGIAVNTLGHCHPAMTRALALQSEQLIHVSNLFRHPLQARLAARLAGYAGDGRLFFCNSGAEANEALLKLARLHGRKMTGGKEGVRTTVICARNAFHGRTFGGMSATPQDKVQGGFRPLLPGFVFAGLNQLEEFAALIDDSTCAIFVETIQGEGGIHPCTIEFLQGLRALCDRHGLLLLLDEVQCGIGRSGSFFAYEEAGIVPDAIGMAKGLGGGFPIGAIWVQRRHESLFQPGSHGTTFGGTPLACAASLAVLDTIEKEDLLAHVGKEGSWFLEKLRQLVSLHPALYSAVRGRGFMLGLQCLDDYAQLQKVIRRHGLLLPAAGGGVLRLLPALNTPRADLEEALSILQNASVAFMRETAS